MEVCLLQNCTAHRNLESAKKRRRKEGQEHGFGGDETRPAILENVNSAFLEDVNAAVSPSLYAFTRVNTRRNLYRIPLQ